MIADHALSIIFKNIIASVMDDYEKLVEIIRSLIETAIKKTIVKIEVRHIIDPILSKFKDFQEKDCFVIKIGYSYYYINLSQTARLRIVSQLHKYITESLSHLFFRDYSMKIDFYGECFDSSYVEKERKNNSGIKALTLADSNENTDIYYWIDAITGDDLESSIVYGIYPKEEVTIESVESNNYRVNIDNKK